MNRWNNDFRDRWIEIWIPNERPLQRVPGLVKIHQTGSKSYPRPTLCSKNNHRFIESRVGRKISHRTLLFTIYIYTVDHFWKTGRPDDHRNAIGCWRPAVGDHFEDRTTFLREKHITTEKGCFFLSSNCKMGWQKWYQKDVIWLFYWSLFFLLVMYLSFVTYIKPWSNFLSTFWDLVPSRYSRRAAEHGRREEYPEVIFFWGGNVNMTPLGEVFFWNFVMSTGYSKIWSPPILK